MATRRKVSRRDTTARLTVVTRPVAVGEKPSRPGPKREPAAARAERQTLARASLAGMLLGLAMVALSLMSVAAGTGGPIVNRADPARTERKTMGSLDSPVVITEWIDYQCPACRAYALTREPVLIERYVNAGKVRLVSRNLAFLGPESVQAAEAADAAADQGRYWTYHDLLFQRQQGENHGAFSPGALKAFASELGLDRSAFDDAIDRGIHRSEVLAEARDGAAQGVNATPTLFINGRKIEGVPAMDELSNLIDQELAKKK